jgi:hypothetical protein
MSNHLSMNELRRRARIMLSVPIMVTSLDTGVKYQAMCDTLDVSSNGRSYGCDVHSPVTRVFVWTYFIAAKSRSPVSSAAVCMAREPGRWGSSCCHRLEISGK